MERLQQLLESSGLTAKESEVYLVLLKLGESPIADILGVTKAHPQIIYRAIDGLIEKQLVTVQHRRHRKYVRAEDPRVLEKRERERLKEVQQAIPDLLALQQTSPDAVIRVLKGNEAIRTVRSQGIDRLRTGDTHYIMGASGTRFYEIMSVEQYAEIERKRIKKGIHKKLLSFESQRDLIGDKEIWTKLAEFRYLPEQFSVPSSTNIFGNMVAILIWSAEPIAITIESAEVAESYRSYFASLWKIATP